MITDFNPNEMEDYPLVMEYEGPSGSLSAVIAGPAPDGSYFKQTYTYTGVNLTGVSGWTRWAV